MATATWGRLRSINRDEFWEGFWDMFGACWWIWRLRFCQNRDLFMLELPMWVSGADFMKIMDLMAVEGSNFQVFCQERIAWDIDYFRLTKRQCSQRRSYGSSVDSQSCSVNDTNHKLNCNDKYSYNHDNDNNNETINNIRSGGSSCSRSCRQLLQVEIWRGNEYFFDAQRLSEARGSTRSHLFSRSI